jgi:hypothetical protein
VFAILLACAAAGLAQEHMADSLRNGILEEDSRQNPGSAIQQYQAVMTQFAEARRTAATALFRMAECYRKQGKQAQAVAAYQRLLTDFADQSKLAAQSRAQLAANNAAAVPPAAAGKQGGKGQDEAKTEAARARYRGAIEEQIQVVENQLSLASQRYKAGVEGYDAVAALQEKRLQLKRDLAAFDAGMVPQTGR